MTSISSPNYRLLTKKEIADKLHCTTRTIDRLVESGRIPCVKPLTSTGKGHRVLFESTAIDAWLGNSAVNEEGGA